MRPAIGLTGARRFPDARRTLAGLVGSCLAILPLRGIFTDWAWLIDAWIAMALVILPAAALRRRFQPRFVHLLPGIVLVIGFLTLRYVPDHAVAGVIPLHGAWVDVSTLSRQFADTVHNQSAPLASTPAVRMVLSAQLALMAIAVDLLAVVARRPALAGVPFLLLYTLSGAVPRHPVEWFWFVAAAAGYLLLLSSDSRDQLARWGRIMPRTSGTRSMTARALSGRRIGVIAILAAICVSLALPIRSGNIVADALHNSSGQGFGFGTGGNGVSLDPFVSLKGSLTLGKPVDLFAVDVAPARGTNPFYLRTDVLDSFNGKGWVESRDRGDLQDIDRTGFVAVPQAQRPGDTISYTATVTVLHNLGGNVPIFARPVSLVGDVATRGWSPQNGLVVARGLDKGHRYTEQVLAPNPTTSQLDAGFSTPDKAQVGQWLELPKSQSKVAHNLVDQLTAGLNSPYEKARALSNYFTNPSNGFVYSLQTKGGDSPNDLTNFLENKVGFCQQYAAAMAVMLRMVGVPARVVIGYTHVAPDRSGRFVVTTRDAHAWVEAYFGSVGWIPFDPTPLTGADAGRAVGLPWAPHQTDPGSSGSDATASDAPNKKDLGAASSAAPATPAGGSAPTAPGSSFPGWPALAVLAVLVLLLIVLLVPLAARLARRRARLRAARAGPDPLWTELADTAIDLGYVWSPVRSPRQVVSWLRDEGLATDASRSLGTLAEAVEQSRYAPVGTVDTADSVGLVADLRRVEGSLRSRRAWSSRVRARLLPGSLGWLRPRRHARRR